MDTGRYVIECAGLGRELPPPGAKSLLQDVGFELMRGQVLGILGPSGAGKSTLLRLLNRLDEPTSGEVRLAGQSYREIPVRELRRRVGMVMQRAYLFPGTVAENVAFGPQQIGTGMEGSAIDALLSQVGLEGYGSRTVESLSGGEAQRVAITRALANGPEVLLLDEPTSALDEAAKAGVERVLANLIAERHLTCIWVTHDAAQARRMADVVLTLQAGRMHSLGPVHEVLGA